MNSVIPDLFETDLWPARWHCGYWSDLHGWTYIASDMLIWLAYFAIPVIILAYTWQKKYELRHTRTYFLFAAFILLCGATHLLDATMFWIPAYRLNTLVRALTGIVSILTVWHLIRILPSAFRERTILALEREVQKRIETEKQLAMANEGLRTFAYMASHDLQEPLRKILMYTSKINEKSAGLDDDLKFLVGKARLATERMSDIIQGILSLSSITQERPFDYVDLREVFKIALADLEIRIREKNAVIRIANNTLVYGNRDYLVQLFTNLLSNAIKFTSTTPEITVDSATKNDQVLISVTDNGIGMRQEDLTKIFNAFERLHPRSEFEGSGIGLAICKRIVEIHHGTIWVKSEVGIGTTFTVALPSRSPLPTKKDTN